jgi:hypothetical protein
MVSADSIPGADSMVFAPRHGPFTALSTLIPSPPARVIARRP